MLSWQCSTVAPGGAEYNLTPYHRLLRCLPGADFSNSRSLPAGGLARQAGRRKNIEWGRPVPKAPTAVGFTWADSQDLAIILDPFRVIFVDLGILGPLI